MTFDLFTIPLNLLAKSTFHGQEGPDHLSEIEEFWYFWRWMYAFETSTSFSFRIFEDSYSDGMSLLPIPNAGKSC